MKRTSKLPVSSLHNKNLNASPSNVPDIASDIASSITSLASHPSSPTLRGGSLLQTTWSQYQTLLQTFRYPILLTALSTSFVAFLGDLLSQIVLCISKTTIAAYSIHRSLIMLIIGFAWTGPVLHILYFYVEKFGEILDNKGITKFKKVTYQVIINQTIGAFSINAGFMFLFYTLQTLFNGSEFSLKTAKYLVASKMKTIVGASWMIWVPASFTNFYWMPKNSRVLFTNVVAAFYNFVLSIIANS
ncbi:hypothetical protein TL16_g11588 [Triparma laevis f. inornata]|uniref:Uncharacterized protein n=1 Tax=Triparma laevis f. inornata TaxID=1714386 RepID=A0A9W7BG42_9STRA|nr:hypothetical protein TL16_g11588 [Triparma laevis f. inornata]